MTYLLPPEIIAQITAATLVNLSAQPTKPIAAVNAAIFTVLQMVADTVAPAQANAARYEALRAAILSPNETFHRGLSFYPPTNNDEFDSMVDRLKV